MGVVGSFGFLWKKEQIKEIQFSCNHQNILMLLKVAAEGQQHFKNQNQKALSGNTKFVSLKQDVVQNNTINTHLFLFMNLFEQNKELQLPSCSLLCIS